MSLREFRRHAGRLAIVGFDGPEVSADLGRLVADFDLGGVIYFARNIVSPDQVAELSRAARDLATSWPFWISVDQEGGRVARLKRPFTEWPPAVTLGRSGDEQLAERFAAALALELRAVGINLDFAPVLDIWTNPKNRVIGDRALGDRADVVARLGRIIIRTLQREGVAACAKHFPGHGDTVADSHDELPLVEHPPDRLDAVELEPFRAAIVEDVATVMMAHVSVPTVDPERPASLSPILVDGWLKRRLGFGGVVVCDDLGMKAVAASRSLGETAVEAVEAGCDIVLLCNVTPDAKVEAIEALIHAAEAGRLSEKRLEDAFDRQERVKAKWLSRTSPRMEALSIVGSDRHQAIAAEMARWA